MWRCVCSASDTHPGVPACTPSLMSTAAGVRHRVSEWSPRPGRERMCPVRVRRNPDRSRAQEPLNTALGLSLLTQKVLPAVALPPAGAPATAPRTPHPRSASGPTNRDRPEASCRAYDLASVSATRSAAAGVPQKGHPPDLVAKPIQELATLERAYVVKPGNGPVPVSPNSVTSAMPYACAIETNKSPKVLPVRSR